MPFKLRAPRLKVSENDVEKACRDVLNLRGYRLHRLHCGKARFPDGTWVQLEEQGMPDWLCVHPAHPAFYLETKAPGGALSPAQRWMHKILSAWRLPVVVVDDAMQLVAWLREHEEPTRR